MQNLSPNDVAYLEYFYQVDAPDDMAAENAYSKLESDFAPVLSEIATKGQLPQAAGLGRLLAFVASQAVRTPAWRNNARRFYSDVARKMIEVGTEQPAVFRAQTRALADPELAALSDDELEELRLYLRESSDSLEVSDADASSKTRLVVQALEVSAFAEDVLQAKHWFIGRTTDPDSRFVTSDSPIALQPAAGAPLGGFGDAWMTVIVPLSPKYVLMGSGSPLRPGRLRVRCDRRMVAELNELTWHNADEWLYSSERRILHLDGDVLVEEA